MYFPSANRCPDVLADSAFSEPARSTRFYQTYTDVLQWMLGDIDD